MESGNVFLLLKKIKQSNLLKMKKGKGK